MEERTLLMAHEPDGDLGGPHGAGADRLRVCLALPNILYRPDVPYVLGTEPLARELSRRHDVTLAYRGIAEQAPPGPVQRRLAIGVRPAPGEGQRSAYTALRHWPAYRAYGREIRRFSAGHAGDFDVVVEIEWPFLGLVTDAFRRHGVPGVVMVEADFTYQPRVRADGSGLSATVRRTVRSAAGVGLEGHRRRRRRRGVRGADGVITETVEGERMLRGAGLVAEGTPVAAVPMAVDPEVFAPLDRARCRRELGIPNHELVLVFAGSLNRSVQDPVPLIEALGRLRAPHPVLHVLGNGRDRSLMAELATAVGARVVFHGRVPQPDVARFCGAADACVAPYDLERYVDGTLTSASLKVPEYLACGRPVLATACTRMATLLDHGRYGDLVPNHVDAYLRRLPEVLRRDHLRGIERTLLDDLCSGRIREHGIVLTWSDVADRYDTILRETVRSVP